MYLPFLMDASQNTTQSLHCCTVLLMKRAVAMVILDHGYGYHRSAAKAD